LLSINGPPIAESFAELHASHLIPTDRVSVSELATGLQFLLTASSISKEYSKINSDPHLGRDGFGSPSPRTHRDRACATSRDTLGDRPHSKSRPNARELMAADDPIDRGMAHFNGRRAQRNWALGCPLSPLRWDRVNGS